DLGGELGVGDLLDGLAAGNTDLQGLGVVEPLPHRLARGGDAALAMHFHRGCPRSGVAKVWAAIAAIATARRDQPSLAVRVAALPRLAQIRPDWSRLWGLTPECRPPPRFPARCRRASPTG